MKHLLLPLIILLCVTGAILLAIPLVPFTLPWEPSRITSVYTTLEESASESLLNTAEFSLKVLYPYDFIDAGDEVPWKTLQRHYNYHRDDYLTRESREFYPEGIIPEAWQYASLYRMCRECGLDPAADPLSFVVIEARLKAGINLRFQEDGSIEGALHLHGSNEKKLDITLPAVQITDIIIVDRPVQIYGYPEVRISPGQWKNLIEALIPDIKELACERGLLDEAARGAALLLTDLFEGAGFEVNDIQFKEH